MTTQVVPNDSTFSAPDNNPTAAYSASKIAKANPGIMYGLTGHNSAATAQFIQLHDSKTLPAEAAVPVFIVLVAAGASFNIDFGVHGMKFGIGMTICNSSTGPAKTIGAADCFFAPRFK